MKYLLIQNAGEIEPEGFKLLGASTKRNDESKIGFFGSGIKYSLSFLLRNELFFEVWSGSKKVDFQLKEVSLRDQSFQKILVNQEETSITTSWGENWSKWQIFREVLSNSIDEDTFTIELVEEIRPVDGLTSFYLSYEDFKQYYDNLSDYFNLNLVDESETSIVKKEGPSPLVVYKKGVRVVPEDEPAISLFNYHIPGVTLNEERIADRWDVEYEITSLLANLDDQESIDLLYKNLLEKNEEIFEVKEILSKISEYRRLSPAWLKALNSSESSILSEGAREFVEEQLGEEVTSKSSIKFVPEKFVQAVERSFGDDFENKYNSQLLTGDYIVVNPTEEQKDLLGIALQKLKNSNIELDSEKIDLVKFRIESVKSHVSRDEGHIYISEDCFKDNVYSDVIPALVEGYLKLKHEVEDGSKKMQEACLELITTLII